MPAGLHYVALLVGLIVALRTIALGPRLAAEVEPARLKRRFLLYGALLMLLAEIPIGHGTTCSMSPAAWMWVHFGAGCWIPYAVYSALGSLCAVRLFGGPKEELLVLGPFYTFLLSVVLEVTLRAVAGVSWLAIHVSYQGVFLLHLCRTISPRRRAVTIALPALASVMPFLPLTFWHACVRLRIDDPVEVVLEKMNGQWLVRNTSTGGGDRVRIEDVDPSSLGERVTFAAVGGVNACFCDVTLMDGRVASFVLSAD